MHIVLVEQRLSYRAAIENDCELTNRRTELSLNEDQPQPKKYRYISEKWYPANRVKTFGYFRRMLELVERKASGISWPTCRARNLDNFGKNPKGGGVLLRRAERGCMREKRWRRDSKGLLCSLGQLGCSDSYSPDTLGTWKFHKASRSRYKDTSETFLSRLCIRISFSVTFNYQIS